MALRTVKHSDPPCVARTFAAGAVRVLHDADAPDGCKHLPAGFVANLTADLVWKDATGTSNTTEVIVGQWYPLAIAELEVGNVATLTVFWRK